MLDQDILQTIKHYAKTMQRDVTFVLNKGVHPKREELLNFLQSIAEVSEKIHLEQRTVPTLTSAISFSLETERDTGIVFSGIPSGHEFNSLILALLQAGGSEIKLDKSIQSLVANIQQPLKFEVFVSLSCHNCPDVVQILNQFALLNNNISAEMIDGALFQELVDERNIQGVPTVFLNGELFANGKVEPAQIIDKLVQRYPNAIQAQQSQHNETQDVTVIGGGPAGVSAAIYSARKGLKVTLIADRIGGQVKDTQGIENFISQTQTTGAELTNELLGHLKDYPITIREHLRVQSIQQGNPKQIQLSSGETIQSKSVIIATGAKWRELGIAGERENIGNGVAYCPHCDGPFFKGKDVAVIGGGNSGVEAALDLAGIVKSVTLFEFLPQLKADQVLVDQLTKRDNIKIRTNVATQQILADNGQVSAISYVDRATETVEQQALEGVFVQIGLVPNSAFVDGLLERTQFGEIMIDERGHTSAEGIFACGDVTTVPYKQIIIAMGEGAKAALSAFDYLLKQN